MKLFITALLFQFSLSLFAQSTPEIGYSTLPSDSSSVYLSWKADPRNTFTILRRTKDTPYEVLDENAKLTDGRWLDKTAEQNVQYYYSIAYELKLNTASNLVYTSDFTKPLKYNSTTHTVAGNSLVITNSRDFAQANISTGLKFNRKKYYELRIDFGQITGNGYMAFNLSGLACDGSPLYDGNLQKYANRSYQCRLTQPQNPNPKFNWFHDDSIVIYPSNRSGNYSVEIKKIELFEQED